MEISYKELVTLAIVLAGLATTWGMLKTKVASILKELEDSTSDAAKFGKTLTRKILSDQLDTVWNLGASYDCLNFESEILYSNLWEKIFERIKSENLF